jgi:hypothetical protein
VPRIVRNCPDDLPVPPGQSHPLLYATASLFWPNEKVTFSWTGPSSGVITTVYAGLDGQATTEVLENADPALYLITAQGLTSGRTASADLRVVSN